MGWLRFLAAIAWLLFFVGWPRATAAVTLVVVGGAFVAFNAVIFWTTVVRKEPAPAVAPIFGGVLGGAGVALLPYPEAWKWAWVPLALDWGGLPLLVSAWCRRGSK